MIKRTIDITCGTVALLILLPLLALISLAIYLEDRGIPLFLQRRYGKNGNTFTLFKFRTMKAAPPEKRQIEDLKNDGRITKVGGCLRSAHLDELPQLLNIIKGDMSIVGPRPIPCMLRVNDILNWQYRSTIRPGLTGMAQVHCTKYTTLRSKFHFDALYVNRMSLWLDTKLIMATAWRIRGLLAFSLWTLVILFATLLPIAAESILSTFEHADKVVHFFLFLMMAPVAIWFGRSFLGNIKNSVLFGVIWCVLLAGGTEFSQSFLPLRNMSLLDFGADIAGIIYGLTMYMLQFVEDWNAEKQNIKTS